ncbi:helix-turn-helix domain-containing protein [Lacipirellula sp.]|uniref:helix-turn-helix domain-containing protein n=1 Tax=Lacipirellula sp. TaxID=2691419 RepID=UPI003D13B635
MEEKLLYTEPQAAKLLNLSTKTLSRLRKAGKLQFVRIGDAIRYELDALTALIQGCRTPA